MIQKDSMVNVILGVVRPKVQITIAGAVELTAFPLEIITSVVESFKPPVSRSAYSALKTQLNAYCIANDVKPLWKDMFQLRESLGIGPNAPKEEQKGSAGSKSDNGFRTLEEREDGSKIVRTPDGQKIRLRGQDYYKRTSPTQLYDEFEEDRLNGKEHALMTNPFTARAHSQQAMDLDEYNQTQQDERAATVEERLERARSERTKAITHQDLFKLASETNKKAHRSITPPLVTKYADIPKFSDKQEALSSAYIDSLSENVSVNTHKTENPSPLLIVSDNVSTPQNATLDTKSDDVWEGFGEVAPFMHDRLPF